jgi:hypothetical protein
VQARGETVKTPSDPADIRGRMRRPAAPSSTTIALLRVRGVGDLAVDVVGATPGAHALQVLSTPVPVRLLHRLPALLERPGGGASGVLVAVPGPGGGMDPRRLDFVEDTAAVTPAADEAAARTPERQRRAHVRVPVQVPFTLSAVIAERDWGQGLTLDLSATGALVGGVDVGLPGDPLRARLDLPGMQDPVRAQVRVVRVAADGARALRVEAIDPRDGDRVRRYLADRQREELRARRQA